MKTLVFIRKQKYIYLILLLINLVPFVYSTITYWRMRFLIVPMPIGQVLYFSICWFVFSILGWTIISYPSIRINLFIILYPLLAGVPWTVYRRYYYGDYSFDSILGDFLNLFAMIVNGFSSAFEAILVLGPSVCDLVFVLIKYRIYRRPQNPLAKRGLLYWWRSSLIEEAWVSQIAGSWDLVGEGSQGVGVHRGFPRGKQEGIDENGDDGAAR